MKFEINEGIKYYYNKRCTEIIKKEFPGSVYSDSKSIEDICRLSIDFLVKEFELECRKLKTTKDVAFFMYWYSDLSQNGNKNDPKIVLYKKICRYVFGEITKMNFLSNDIFTVDSAIMSNLYCLTELIDNLAQNLYEFYLVDKKYHTVEIFETYFGVTLTEDYHVKQKEFRERMKANPKRDTCVPETIILDYKNVTIEAFGEPAKKFYDTVFAENSNPIVICDSSALSFSEFSKIVNSNSEPDNAANIVDVTSLVNYYSSDFLGGLILSGDIVDLSTSIHKPHHMIRSRFRPIFKVKCNGGDRYITTPYIAFESMDELISNEIPFNKLPKEWKRNQIMSAYAKKLKESQGKWLEDAAERIFTELSVRYLRNKVRINGIDLLLEPVGVSQVKHVGEIDFILIDFHRKQVGVVDCKFMISKYHFPTFSMDKQAYSEGDDCYEKKLSYKYNWVKTHLRDIQMEAKVDIDISNFEVEAFFISNSLTFYALMSKYPIVPLGELKEFLHVGIEMGIPS